MQVKVKEKNGVWTLKIGTFKLKASEPSIQPFNEYVYEDEKDIMHFYYTLEMYRKPYKKDWKKVISNRVYEFGIMAHVPEFLREVLDFDVDKNGLRHYFKERNNDGTVTESKTEYEAFYPFSLSGMFGEDRIEIQKRFRTFDDCRGHNEFELYDVNIFIGGNELGAQPYGVHFGSLEREDIEEMLKFYEGFMVMANKVAKENVETLLTNDEDNEYNDPKKVRDHLRVKYGIENWRPIFIKLSREDYVLDEYVDYITGKTPVENLRCHEWHGEQRDMKTMLETMKDYEAYMHIIDDNRHDYKE
jgi:hypothetical protein